MRQDPDSHSQKKAARPDKAVAPTAAPPVFFNEDPAASLLREYPFLEAPAQSGEPCRLAGYEVLKELGAGGMGVVFLGRDPKLEREVALKVIKVRAGSASEGEVQRKRLIREARAAAKIQSDHVVRIHEVGEANGAPFIAMELLAGADLETMESRWRQPGGGLPLLETLRIGKEIARGLAAAHHLGIVHRDITPRNLWVDDGNDNRIKILDFGLCKSLLSDDETLTQQGITQGTPGFMPPEQVRGEEIDHRADLFNLGVILYWLCAGSRPFHRGKAILDTLNATVSQTPCAPSELTPEIPARLSVLILRLLEKNRDQRPQSAQEVADELDAIVRELSPPTAPTTATAVSTQSEILSQQATLGIQLSSVETHGPLPRPGSTSAVLTGRLRRVRRIAGAAALLLVGAIGSIAQFGHWMQREVSPTTAAEAPAGVTDVAAQGAEMPDLPEPATPPPPAPAAPESDKPADEYVSLATGMKFRLIPAGEFLMGSLDTEEFHQSDEGPQHRVKISKPFYMGVHEVTQGEFESVTDRNPSHFSASGKGSSKVTGKETSRFPVENVTWFDAIETCNLLSTRDGLTEYYGLTDIERNADHTVDPENWTRK